MTRTYRCPECGSTYNLSLRASLRAMLLLDRWKDIHCEKCGVAERGFEVRDRTAAEIRAEVFGR